MISNLGVVVAVIFSTTQVGFAGFLGGNTLPLANKTLEELMRERPGENKYSFETIFQKSHEYCRAKGYLEPEEYKLLVTTSGLKCWDEKDVASLSRSIDNSIETLVPTDSTEKIVLMERTFPMGGQQGIENAEVLEAAKQACKNAGYSGLFWYRSEVPHFDFIICKEDRP